RPPRWSPPPSSPCYRRGAHPAGKTSSCFMARGGSTPRTAPRHGAGARKRGPADLSGGFWRAAGLVLSGDDARAYLFSGGIVQPLSSSFTAGLPFPVEYHRVGVSGENVGLTSLTVRTSAQLRAAYLHVQNFGQQPRSVTVE